MPSRLLLVSIGPVRRSRIGLFGLCGSGRTSLRAGAGDENRTHDIQLGKLDGSQSAQHVGCKTADIRHQCDQGLTAEKQNAQSVGQPRAFPRTISEWDRNAREIVRVALDQFNGRYTVNVRVWYRDGEIVKPSKTGITLSIKHLPQLATAMSLALAAAREAGLVDEGGGA